MKRHLIVPKKKAVQPTIVESNTLSIFGLRSSNATPTPGTVIYERLTIHLPYKELYQLIREGKINVEQARFIESKEYRELPDDIIRSKLKQIEHQEAQKEYASHAVARTFLEKKYSHALYNTNPYLPFRCPWMLPEEGKKSNREIYLAEQLQKHLGKQTRFFDVYNYLDNKIVNSEEDLFPGRWVVAGIERKYAIIRINKDFYDMAEHKLSIGQKSISIISIKKYIKSLCDLGILKRLQDGKQWRDSLYAVGYWTDYQYGNYRVIRFLTKTDPGIQALLDYEI